MTTNVICMSNCSFLTYDYYPYSDLSSAMSKVCHKKLIKTQFIIHLPHLYIHMNFSYPYMTSLLQLIIFKFRLACKSGVISSDDLNLKHQNYFSNYVKVMSSLTDKFFSDVTVLVATMQPATSREQSQLAGDKNHDRQFFSTRWERRKKRGETTSKVFKKIIQTHR